MKMLQKIKSLLTISLIVVFIGNIYKVNAQDEKQSLSISLMYNKITGVDSYLDITASYKNDKGWQIGNDVPFEILKTKDGEELSLGKGVTDMHGKAKFVFPKGTIELENDVIFRISGLTQFEDADESISFKDVNLTAQLNLEDGSKQITATLLDMEGNPIADEGLKVQVKRIFKGLPVGDGMYTTDENGTIVVNIEEEYNSFDGKLIFEVLLEEHEDYGTVKALMNADFGIPGKDLSTFDERKMWSPANKTPLFLLIFPNLVLLGILTIFVYLIVNLIKISKS